MVKVNLIKFVTSPQVWKKKKKNRLLLTERIQFYISPDVGM